MKTEKMTISNNDKLALISNLSTMLTAGIPILETVKSLSEESKDNLKKILELVHDDLIQGKNLSQSFARFPKIFSKINLNILKSSEESGTLETALKDLRDNIRRDMEFTDKIKAALLYPIILLVIFAAMFLLVLLFVIPRIATIFSNLKVVLPLPTKIMIFTSTALRTHSLPILAVLLLLVLLLVYLYRTKKKSFYSLFSRLPVLSNLFKEIDLSRFSRSLALLLSSNITIINALELVQDVVVNSDIKKAIADSKRIIASGGKLSEGLKTTKNKSIPGIIVKIIESGEKTGSLDKAMQDVSDYMDYNVTNDLKTTTTLLEPVILVVVGLFLGVMMISIIAPIYNLISQINNG